MKLVIMYLDENDERRRYFWDIDLEKNGSWCWSPGYTSGVVRVTDVNLLPDDVELEQT